jgi:hypothetical protein
VSTLADALEKRRTACRLTPELALATIEEAERWIYERGIVTGTADCSLPSLHAAIHEEPYREGGRGFAAYPKTKWWWGGALADKPGTHHLKLHRGRAVFVSEPVARLADPLCRRELTRADAGEHGADAKTLVEVLHAGPALLDDLKADLGFEAKRLRTVREALERVGAIVSGHVVLGGNGGHRHTSELRRWDQLFPEPSPGGLGELLVAGVRAAVVVPEQEVRGWFSWRVDGQLIGELVAAGRLTRLEDAWLCEP